MTGVVDTTPEFSNILKEMQFAWPADKRATDKELLLLTESAMDAMFAQKTDWLRLSALLRVHMDDPAPGEIASITSRCRLNSYLGSVPTDADDFIPLFLARRKLAMNYAGQFQDGSKTISSNRVLREMYSWTQDFPKIHKGLEWAFPNYMDDERDRIMKRCVLALAYDAAVDPGQTELDKLVRMMVRPAETPDGTEKLYKMAKAVVACTIHRMKNHMMAAVGILGKDGSTRWRHYQHLMLVLYGTQRDGKSAFVKKLLSPLSQFRLVANVGFDFMEHDAKQEQLAVYPAMFFDEMANASAADIEKLKSIMTESERSLRRMREEPAVRDLIATFIACTNKDINSTIKDITGMRRFAQFETQKVAFEDVNTIDAEKIWRSVDEDGPIPTMADAEIMDLLDLHQKSTQTKSAVQCWVEECDIPRGWHSITYLFSDSFLPYKEVAHKLDKQFTTAQMLKNELKRLRNAGNQQILINEPPAGTKSKKTALYSILSEYEVEGGAGDNNVTPMRDPRQEVRDLMAKAKARSGEVDREEYLSSSRWDD